MGQLPSLATCVHSDMGLMGTVPDTDWKSYLRVGQPVGLSQIMSRKQSSLVGPIEACWVLSGFSPNDSGGLIMGC